MKQHFLLLSKEKKLLHLPLYPQCFDIHLDSQYQGPSALNLRFIKFYYIGFIVDTYYFCLLNINSLPFLWQTSLLYHQCMALGGADPPLSSGGGTYGQSAYPIPRTLCLVQGGAGDSNWSDGTQCRDFVNIFGEEKVLFHLD